MHAGAMFGVRRKPSVAFGGGTKTVGFQHAAGALCGGRVALKLIAGQVSVASLCNPEKKHPPAGLFLLRTGAGHWPLRIGLKFAWDIPMVSFVLG